MLRAAVILAIIATPAQAQWTCDTRKYCGQMEGCAEAVFQLRQCGASRRDADNDGIPCESVCGKTKQAMQSRLANGSAASTSTFGFTQPSAETFSCTPGKTCGRMTSCEEARFQLEQCGNGRLDGNSDGIPCNSLCRGR